MDLIRFQPITLESLSIIGHYSALCDNHVSDYSLANLYGWQPRFNTQYAIVDDHLVIRFLSDDGTWYMRPLPAVMGDCSDTMRVIERLRLEAFRSGHDFSLYGMKAEEAAQLQSQYADRMTVQPLRNSAGYLYLRERLASLAGRKLQPKRNHVNKFRSLYPDFEYHEMDASLAMQCLDFATRWAERHLAAFPEQSDSAEAELNAIRRCLDNWERLPLIGGTLWAEGQLIAFTYGCPVSDDTLDVCVEKADTSYEGAYTVINQLFAQHVPDRFIYLNREEDLGVEGLRKAKLSYHPDDILIRCLCFEPLPRPADECEQTRALWQQVFSDSDAFVDIYFSKIYRPERNVCCLSDGRVLAALQLLPHYLKWHNQQVPSAYVSGVAVREDSRCHGIGRQLVRQAHIKAYGDGIVFLFLVPANERVGQWYQSLGYAFNAVCHSAPQDILYMDFESYDSWQRSQEVVLLHSSEDFSIAQQDIRCEGLSADRADYPAMSRVINVSCALNLYARIHPERAETIRVFGDQDLPSNNGIYRVESGGVRRLLTSDTTDYSLSISQLSIKLFEESAVSLAMMLER